MPTPTDQLDQKRTELILQQLEQLPTLPAVAMQVLDVTGNESSSARDVVQLIESDVSLTARILHLVHRPDMGVRGDVNTVERAVVLLGFAAVRSAVLAVSVFETFGAGPARKFGHFARDEFWKHSIAVACCAELLAEKLAQVYGKNNGIEPSQAFVAGLLHDLGKVALDACLPKSFDRVVEAVEMLRGNIADVERKVIGLDHMVVGKRLAERWQLPPALRDVIWLHGQLPQALPATVKSPRLVNLITLADQLVREQHIGYSGNYTFTVGRQGLLDSVGLTDEHVKEMQLTLVSRIEPRAAALGLNRASSNELYQQALSRANKELGRVSEQLVTKNRRLAVRAKFFDALSGFQSELRPDAPPQTVLQAVGQTAVGVLDVKFTCVFSLPPGQGFAETMLFDEQGNPIDNLLVDCHTRAEKPQGGDGPVLPCGDEMEWIISAISPRLGHDQRFWICLEADGQCIGGVVWGAPAGESQRLSTQTQELTAIAGGWSLALRTAQIREEARTLSEQLAEANRQLHNAQNEIMRSKMLISIGEVAAGAAHEMNNPLAVISGRSQLLVSALTDEKLKGSAKQIYDQTHRLSDLITELMNYAKPEPPKCDRADLADLIDRALQEARKQADVQGRSIELTLSDVPPVHVDDKQTKDALVEIVTNAIHATDPQKGRIELHAAFDPYSARVAVTITDNGFGMDDRTLKHAFDPFFSNQKAGRRRGMGLAKALRWVEGSGGAIRLESRVDQGTRVIVLLPAAQVEQVSQPAMERKAAT